MSKVIDEYFNGNFHFVPPPKSLVTLNGTAKSVKVRQKTQEKIKLEDALYSLHLRIGECLRLEEGKKCVDIGCGIGGVIEDLAVTGAELTGLTIAPNEVS